MDTSDKDIGAALIALGVPKDMLGDCSDARVVIVESSMAAAVEALGRGTRDQVVMTRIDAETARALDRWVDTGIAKSRSEAAALFLREGLKLREAELNELGDALQALETARDTLRRRVRSVMGDGASSQPAA